MAHAFTQQINDSLFQEIVERVVGIAHPSKIVLFGSRARGDARPDSDIDLLIIAPSTEPGCQRSIPLYKALSDIHVPIDILVYNPDEVVWWSNMRQALVTTALREGKVLYDGSGYAR
ncbi:MAG TPA: nucleotidyltransferase domain-containing protein [Chloroflexia bacterium]|nr:nucleotidyltransferase domain-containing protein [Chloroflexia bacterium]